jgi:hypothetical protein
VRAANLSGASAWSATASAATLPLAPDFPLTFPLGHTANTTITSPVSSATYALDAAGLLTLTGTSMTLSTPQTWRFTTNQNAGTSQAGSFALNFTSYQDVDAATGAGVIPAGGYNNITSNGIGLGVGVGANGNFLGNAAGADGEEGIVFGLDATALPPGFALRVTAITVSQTGTGTFTGLDSARVISGAGANAAITQTLGSVGTPVLSATIDVSALNLLVAAGASVPELFTVMNGTDGSQQGFRVQSLQVAIGPSGKYAAWAAAYAGGQSAALDFNGDGVTNGIAFFMGANGSTYTPMPGIVNGTVTWPRNPAAIASWHVQLSTTLAAEGQPGGWAAAPPGTVVDAGTAIILTLPTTGPRAFARLKVTIP